MHQIVSRWHRFSFLLLASLFFCLGIHAMLPGQADQLATATQRQLITSTLVSTSGVVDSQVVQQGLERYQAGKFAEAIALWQQALPQIWADKDRVIVLNNLALAYRQTGKLSEAITHWEQAVQIYRSQRDPVMRQPLAGILIEQAQAYNALGQHQRAITMLQSALEITQQTKNPLHEAAAQGAIGNAYWALGDYELALTAQQTSLKIARELNNPIYIATALNNLGNIYVGRGIRYGYQATVANLEGDDKEAEALTQSAIADQTEARKLFEQSVQTAKNVTAWEEIRGLMNLTRLLQQSSPTSENLIVSNWQRVQELLNTLPDSRDKAYALINLAESFKRYPVGTQSSNAYTVTIEQALAVASKIGDARAESFAWGSLAHLQEAAGDYRQAIELTRKAQFAAQKINAPDSLYLWQWQAGRLLKAMGQKEQAIVAYQQAITTLQSIRDDIVVANQELQFDFREQVEPVYRELIALLLESASSTKSNDKTSPIAQVVDTLELLKLAELQNFFGKECVQILITQGKSTASLMNTNTVVIYTVILENQTQIILRAPNGSFTNYPVAMGKDALEKEINQLRYLLELRQTEQYLSQSQKIYNLLIRPIEANLAAIKPRTLMFINDGVLRKVPMAALHDGQAFLIEKYPIANTPSLNLTNRRPLESNNLEALSVGLTVARPPFAALSNVQAEVRAVKKTLGGIELIDQAFTIPNVETQLQKNSYPVVHIATHGKFGVDAKSTFLVGYDQLISLQKLDDLLRSRKSRQPVQLLTLSACQTAAGDNRSALGMGGVAVRAGVESAMATLWYINDQATVPLIEEFYSQLRQPNMTKANALRNAQLKMIADESYNHPAVWSPFILIGNWI